MGGHFGFFENPVCCKISNKLKGGHFEGKKIRKKVAQCRKKLKEGLLQSRPLSPCSKKFLAKAITRTRDHWVHRKLSKVYTKKWYIQNESVDKKGKKN